MRVLVVVTRSERGGVATHIQELVESLSGRVDFGLVTGENNYLLSLFRKKQLFNYLIPLTRNPNPFKDLKALAMLHMAIREFKPDLLHLHTFKAGLLGRIVAFLSKIPVVYTPHAWSFVEGTPWYWRASSIPLEWFAARLGGKIICVSRDEFRLAQRYGIATPNNSVLVYNSVRDNSLRARLTVGGEVRVVMVGRFVRQKAQALLVEAFAQLKPTPARLWLVGDGPNLAEVKSLVVRLGLQDKVTLLGNRADVPELLADAHIFVLSSNWEGLPISILEAMRAGLPVIASDVGGVSEVVIDQETGFVVPRGNKQALVVALQTLIGDSNLRSKMGAASRKRYEAYFTPKQQLEMLLQLYRSMTNLNRSVQK